MKRIALVVVLLALGTSAAHAEEPERDEYFGSMVLTDLAILISAGPVISASEHNQGATALLYGLAYLSAGPIIHAVHGNHGLIGRSLAKRALLPVASGAVGTIIGLVAVSGCSGDMCGLGAVVAGALGTAVGMMAAVISDWTTGRVDRTPARVTPTLTADADRVSLGVVGAF